MTRKEAIDVLKHNYPSACFEDLCKAVDIAIKALSAEVPDRNVGKWVEDGKGFYKCTACDGAWSHWWSVVVPPERLYKELRYCPHCGAEMRGDVE